MRRIAAGTLLLCCPLLAAPSPTHANESVPPDLLEEISVHFHAARKWFGMVSDLAFEVAPDGALTPRYEWLRSRFVLPRDPAGQSLSVRLPGVITGPIEVWLEGADGVSVRTVEVGLKGTPAERVRGMVVYRGAVVGGDLLYKLTPTHVDEYLYLREPPPILHREFEFDTGPGVRAVREAGRLVEVIDKNGIARMRLAAPVARAADGTRRSGTVHIEGHRLVEEVDLRGLLAPILVDPDWTTTGTMSVSHFAEFGYRRPDGAVMAVGGCTLAACPLGLPPWKCSQVLVSTDVWNPASGTWTFGPALQTARFSFAGAVLRNGDLLVAGGCTASGCATATALAERYSVAEGAFVPAGALPNAVGNVTAAALPGGDALVAGGCDANQCFADAARFQAAQSRWVKTAPLSGARGYATTTALADGTILVVGGCADPACAIVLGDAERYDPIGDTWSAVGSMSSARAGHIATLLDDGTVLVTGGCSAAACAGATLASTDLWRSGGKSGGAFASGPPMNAPRHHHTASRLESGEILVAGGADGSDVTRAASEIYMPVARRFIDAPRMMMSRAYHIAVGLSSGDVLVGGGCNPATCIPWAEVFSPAGLPVDVADGGAYEGGVPIDLGAAAPPDWGAPRTVHGGPHPKLFRTGVASCATDDQQDLPCPIAGWPTQDGDESPDQHPMQPRGEEVEDLVTGLVWQAKEGGKSYAQAAAIEACANLATATADAGAWRLPSVVELMTINDYSLAAPSLDQAFIGAQPTNYWTASPVTSSAMLGWTVDFDAGEVAPVLKNMALPIRCVRGAFQVAQAPGHLRLAGPLAATPLTVRDDANILEWQRRDDGVKRSWQDSLSYCADLALEGQHDWHLPNVFELLSLLEFGATSPVKIDPLFTDPRGDIYWTSTFNEGQPTTSWSVNFNLGFADGVNVAGQGYARCVRHIQPPPPDCGCRLGSRGNGGGAAAIVFGLLVLFAARRRWRGSATGR